MLGYEGPRDASVAVLEGMDLHELVVEPGGHQQGVVKRFRYSVAGQAHGESVQMYGERHLHVSDVSDGAHPACRRAPGHATLHFQPWQSYLCLHGLRSSAPAPPAIANIKTMSTSVAALLFLTTTVLACASTPNHEWPYSRLHPDLAHKVMHAKETANPGQSPATSERVKVTIRAESGQEGEEITQWLNDNGLQFTYGYVFGWPAPGFRRWFQFGSDGENTFHASVPVLLLPELSWVLGVDFIEPEPPWNDDQRR